MYLHFPFLWLEFKLNKSYNEFVPYYQTQYLERLWEGYKPTIKWVEQVDDETIQKTSTHCSRYQGPAFYKCELKIEWCLLSKAYKLFLYRIDYSSYNYFINYLNKPCLLSHKPLHDDCKTLQMYNTRLSSFRLYFIWNYSIPSIIC